MGHPNGMTSSRVKATLLNGWILPIGAASAVEGLLSTGLPHLVFGDFKSRRTSKSHFWFKSYSDFAE